MLNCCLSPIHSSCIYGISFVFPSLVKSTNWTSCDAESLGSWFVSNTLNMKFISEVLVDCQYVLSITIYRQLLHVPCSYFSRRGICMDCYWIASAAWLWWRTVDETNGKSYLIDPQLNRLHSWISNSIRLERLGMCLPITWRRETCLFAWCVLFTTHT